MDFVDFLALRLFSITPRFIGLPPPRNLVLRNKYDEAGRLVRLLTRAVEFQDEWRSRNADIAITG